MYFNLPKEGTTTTGVTDERISEIVHNLDDHWGSPPILTPNTLSHILNTQWPNEQDVSKAATTHHYSQLMSVLIKEFCKTIQSIDKENNHKITKHINNDLIIQKILTNSHNEVDENALKYLIYLLKLHNE